jgi:hypothetical protein
VIESLLSGLSVAETAEKFSLHPDSISRMRRNPEFVTAFKLRRRQLWDQARATIEGAQVRSVETLMALLGHKDPRVRLRAAETLLRAGGQIGADVSVEVNQQQQQGLGVLTNEQLRELKERLAVLKELKGQVEALPGNRRLLLGSSQHETER